MAMIAKNNKFYSGPRGKSAYEVAVKNGFEGTEQEWLDSLKGSGNGSGDNNVIESISVNGSEITPDTNKNVNIEIHKFDNESILDSITQSHIEAWNEADKNVQSDWNDSDTTSDAFIKNKPTFEVLTTEDIEDMLGLSTEELAGLASIISDTEVRIDKTYSSSKIYTELQRVLADSKTYTLSEIGKASGASYKVAASTANMTDPKYIYLLKNGDTYDLYIYEEDSATATKIGETAIDLSDYYAKTEINNAFVDKAAFTLLNNSVGDVSTLSTASKVVVDAINELNTAIDNILDGTTTVSKASDAEKINGLAVDDFAKTTDLDDYLPKTGGIVNGPISFQTVDNGYCGVTKAHTEQSDQGMLIQDVDKDGNVAAIKLCANTGKATFHKDRVSSEEILHAGNIESYLGVNIPRTEIAINATDFSAGTICYTVINGICYVEVIALAPITTGGHKHVGLDYLPTPATSIFTNGIYDIATPSTEPLNAFYMDANSGVLVCHVRSASNTYCSFSYPVKVPSPDDQMTLYSAGANDAEFAYEACNVFPMAIVEPSVTLGDNLILEMSNPANGGAGGVISKAIDLTKYNTLRFTHSSTTTTANSYNRTSCYVLNDKVIASAGWWNNFVATSVNMLIEQSTTSGEITIDVSSLTGEHYIYFEVSAETGVTTTLTLSNVYLTV